jgi:type I restriction-modification system DNA methylase subunit
LLYLILNTDSVFSDLPLKLKEETKFHEQEVSGKLYKDYSVFKNKLFENLIKNNPDNDKLTLFHKSQKLLDRFLFILFAEDSGLLPPNSISRIIDTYHKLEELYSYKPIYDIYKQYFGFMNIGRKGKTDSDNIPAYNGGLFYTDDLLDNLKIDDEILIDELLRLSEYDFNTEVDVNILGHIFEHSLSEIEEITAEIEGTSTDKAKSKRKKDGVFYTPKYITQYIVENTIGTLCNEKRAGLEIEEIEFDGTYRTKDGNLSAKGKKLYQKLNNYKDWLLSLKIVDPACGSGAFLNQALNFLIQEHKNIDDIIAELTNTALRLFDTEKSIIENNLFGVDINEESVEIAKLSLWLRTAHKDRKLSNLNNNIKCGNSLIDDPEIAGDKAFDWNKEFPEIMQNGGFDVAIGNPPYGAELSEEQKEYLEARYNTFEYQVNTYVLFYERGVEITRKGGMLGYITPATFTYQHFFTKLREFLQEYKQIGISKYLYEVFEDADIGDSVSWILRKVKNDRDEVLIQICRNEEESMMSPVLKKYKSVVNEDKTYLLSESGINISNFFNDSKNLLEVAAITVGIKAYQKGKGYPKQTAEIVKDKIFTSDSKIHDSYIQCIIGKNFYRYSFLQEPSMYLSYGKWLAEPRESAPFFDDEKIILRQTADSLIGHIDNLKRVNLNNVYNIGNKDADYKLRYLLALLNSKLLNLIYQNISQEKGRTFAEVKKVNLAKLPIKIADIKSQQPFIENVDKMLDLNKHLQEKRNRFLKRVKDNFEIEKISKRLETFYNFDFKIIVAELIKQKVKLSLVQQDEWEEYFNTYKKEINQLQDEINTTDKEIDQMVYELYGLSKNEIAILENSKN